MAPHSLDPPDAFAPKAQGLDHADLRKVNERAVLTIVSLNPGVSGADVSRRSGLSPQSVSAMLTDFEHRGLVLRRPVVRGKRGQPATPFELNTKGAFAVGCELGWRHVEVFLVDLGMGVLGRYSRDYRYPDARTVVGEVAEAVNSMIQALSASDRQRIVGMGLAMPGTISRNIGWLSPPPEQAELWASLDVPAALGELTGLPISVFNDGTAGCWSELAGFPKPRPGDLAYIQVSTFVGAGILAGGTLWEGSTGNAANLGSMLVPDANGAMKTVHTIASIFALEKLLVRNGQVPPEGDPGQWNWADLEPVATRWLEEAARAIALVIVNARAMTEFHTAVVGGIMPPAIVARLVGLVRAHLATGPDNTFDAPNVVQGSRGRHASALGAAILLMYRKLFSRRLEDILEATAVERG